jgi:hypothetical protein
VTSDKTWQYRIVRVEAADTFEDALNSAAVEGWEAISGGFGVGETKKVSLGQGMPVSTQAGVPMWSALMKRARKSG